MTPLAVAPHREQGFTLLELLVTLVIFGLLLTSLAQGTRFALAARTLQVNRIGTNQDLDAVDRTLRHLIGTMDPGMTREGTPQFIGNARSMSFTAVLPASAPFQAWQGDFIVAVDPEHRLTLRWAPHYPALRGPPPSPRVTPLLDGLDHIELSYWSAVPPHPAWLDRWDAKLLPQLIRLRIVFAAGDGRHWPDIVASTGVN